MKLIKNKKGFTLVELLLVMAIIGILAGIIFISIGPARKRARITAFKKTMQDIATAATLCVDSGGTIQPAAAGAETALCSGETDMGNYSVVKSCRGGNGTVAVDVQNANADDFVITAICPVIGTGDGAAASTSCYARCDINGCRFDNTDNSTSPQDNDGCPKTK